MFTGIVRDRGRIVSRQDRGDVELVVQPESLSLEGTQVGDSISVNGVCLTVTRQEGRSFSVDVSRETLSLTTLGSLAAGDAVNLEPALRVGAALGGHLVSGHIDGTARLLGRRADARSERFEFELPQALERFVAVKGSICIDGVSLTVNELRGGAFGVNVIPHTLHTTTFGSLQPGARVNLEVDLLARYVARLAECAP